MKSLTEMFDRELGDRSPNAVALALVVCNWLRARGEAHRTEMADSAPGWVHLLIGEICDDIALRGGTPARFAEAARRDVRVDIYGERW